MIIIYVLQTDAHFQLRFLRRAAIFIVSSPAQGTPDGNDAPNILIFSFLWCN